MLSRVALSISIALPCCLELLMSRVESIEGEISSLSPDELRALREWFAQFDADAWDRQIEADADNPKLRSLVQKALREHEEGRSTDL